MSIKQGDTFEVNGTTYQVQNVSTTTKPDGAKVEVVTSVKV